MTRSLKTANTTGYVEALGPVGKVTVGCETGEIWVKPVENSADTPATPTSAAIPANAGDKTDYIKIGANESMEFDLAEGFSADHATVRFTHLQIWSVSAAMVSILGS